MNELSADKQAQVIAAICEGVSIRATARMTGVSKNAVARLIVNVGTAVNIYQDRAFRNLDIHRIECDEIWAFCSAKEANVPADRMADPDYGSIWTWVALDAETKLVPTWHVGDRSPSDCYYFLRDLKDRIRKGNRIQLTTDGLPTYQPVVYGLWRDRIDYAVVIKEYGNPTADEARRYSPSTVKSSHKEQISGNPDEALVSTSYVERQNLTMRMNIRRYTRLTNGFSKKAENHAHATALHFAYYNLCRPHQTLTKKAGRKTTPAMAAGVADHVWAVRELVALMDRYVAVAA
jgi:IS1 family transposase